MTIDRRQFLTASAGIALGTEVVAVPSKPLPEAGPESPGPQEGATSVEYEVSLAQWSLHRALQSGELTALDFPRAAKRDYGITAVEYVNAFFKDKAGDFSWLRELKTRCEDEGVRSLLIMVDGEGALGASDDEERRRAIEKHFKWAAASAYLGGHAIRVNAAGDGPLEEHAKRAADSLHRLATLAEDYGVSVIVENHGGPSSNGEWLAGVMRLSDHAGVGTLPDFGNFRIQGEEWYDKYKGMTELMPFAKAVSAKSHAFDESGNEEGIDYRRMIEIVMKAGYSGYIGVEYEGSKHSEAEGIQLTRDLLLRIRDERERSR